MCHRADLARPEGEDEHPSLLGPRDHGRRVGRIDGQLKDEDVRLHVREVKPDLAACGEPLTDPPGVRMVVRQPLDVVVRAYAAAAAKPPTWRIAPPAIRR